MQRDSASAERLIVSAQSPNPLRVGRPRQGMRGLEVKARATFLVEITDCSIPLIDTGLCLVLVIAVIELERNIRMRLIGQSNRED